jgi:preprotein translocase subunit Sec63
VHKEKQAKKEEQEKKREEYRRKKQNQGHRMSQMEDKEKQQKLKDMLQIMMLLALLLTFMGGMKYMEERFAVIGRNRNKENFRDFYQVLELEPSVSNLDIKKQYKKLAV